MGGDVPAPELIRADRGLAELYLRRAAAEVDALQAQLGAIRRAGGLVAESWSLGGKLWVAQGRGALGAVCRAPDGLLFGELTSRASGPFAAGMLDHGGGKDDPVTDLAGVQPRDVILIASITGSDQNVDKITDLARARGCKVIALTQLIHARSGRLATATPSGQFLADRADVAVDLGGVFGDGVIDSPGASAPFGPLSGVAGVSAAWAVIVHAAEALVAGGFTPHFSVSAQMPGSKERNLGTVAAFRRLRDALPASVLVTAGLPAPPRAGAEPGAAELPLDGDRRTVADGDLAAAYLARVSQEVRQLTGQLTPIWRAGAILAESWRAGGTLWVSESNHCMHGELVSRPGAPVAARWLDHGDSIMNPIRDVPGVRAGDVVLLHSGAGTSRICDGVTTLAQARGARVIALTQSVHATSLRILYTGITGRPVIEIADVSIDIGGALGDGGLTYTKMPEPVGPLSGSVGVPAAWAVIAHAVELLALSGETAPFESLT